MAARTCGLGTTREGTHARDFEARGAGRGNRVRCELGVRRRSDDPRQVADGEGSERGVQPAKRSVKGSGKETGSSDTLVGDPTLAGTAGGAFLDLIANGTHPTSQRFQLDQGIADNGQPFWSKIGTTGFRYKDAKGKQGPVKSVLIKRSPSGAFSIKVKLTGKNGAINVVPPDSGTDGCMALDLVEGASHM